MRIPITDAAILLLSVCCLLSCFELVFHCAVFTPTKQYEIWRYCLSTLHRFRIIFFFVSDSSVAIVIRARYEWYPKYTNCYFSPFISFPIAHKCAPSSFTAHNTRFKFFSEWRSNVHILRASCFHGESLNGFVTCTPGRITKSFALRPGVRSCNRQSVAGTEL